MASGANTQIPITIGVVIKNPQATGKNLYTIGDEKIVVDLVTTFAGDTHTNTTVDGITSTAGITKGMFVFASNITPGTYVVSVDSATAITISAAASGSATVTLTFQKELFRYNTADVIEKNNLGAAVAEQLQVTDVAYTATNNTTYSFLITQNVSPLNNNPNPLPVNYASDSTATSAEVANNLAAIVNSYAMDNKLQVTAVAVSGSNKITITANAGYPIFIVSGAINTTPSTTTAGIAAFGTGEQLNAQFLPPDDSQQVQRPEGQPYINTNYPLAGTTYAQAFIKVNAPIGVQNYSTQRAVIRYYYMIVTGSNSAACAANLTA